jgi:cystathionine beta-lyase family protein involved in aluminum resistance
MLSDLKNQDYILHLLNKTEKQIVPVKEKIEQTSDFNQWKVLKAFKKHQVSDFHFASSTGYGYNDRGREVLDLVYADVFGAESALVRPHFVSGTHTITVALFGLLRPGDRLLYITGAPYDTLHSVIGSSLKRDIARPTPNTKVQDGSLADFGISTDCVALKPNGKPDFESIAKQINIETKVIAIQRSRGYDWRPSFTVAEIEEMVQFIKEIRSDLIIFVDNCYGEFTEAIEPTDVGVDLMAGSLIKNPGGGLVASGGYIVGKQKYVEKAAFRLTAPGIGGEVGAMLGTNRSLFQGLFLAPHFVAEAMKGGVLVAALLENIGFETHPKWNDTRTDLIQAIRFDSAEAVIAFCEAVQASSPVDGHVTPEPWDMPGYEDPIIMAAGTFISGASLELSADAPIREPFIAYMQGGLTFSHVKIALATIINRLIEKDIITVK